MLVNPVRLLPSEHRIEIPTLFARAEVRVRLQEGVGPDVRIDVHTGLAHDVLHKVVNAVGEMDLVQLRRRLAMGLRMVVLPICLFP